jgi:phospho-N-acetylmuramoyl-pentapeptide-transferase
VINEIIQKINILESFFSLTSSRFVFAFLTAFFLSLFFFPCWIQKLKNLNVAQQIRLIGPDHQSKKGTPTLGGVMIFMATFLSSMLWMNFKNMYFLTLNLCSFLFGFVGFLDDWTKLTKQNHKGLSPKKKMCFLILSSLMVLGLHFFLTKQTSLDLRSQIHIPFIEKNLVFPFAFLIMFWVFMMVGSSNATNLTDGLDGLLTGPVITCSLMFVCLTYTVGNKEVADYLNKHFVPGSSEIVVYLGAMIGSLLGFLWYNSWPAIIFMGDAGSLSAGGVLAYIAIATGHEILYSILGGFFVIETISVIVQILFYKKTKKRIFKMAPIHHHFEKSGWPEQKVTVRAWIVSFVFAILVFLSLKLK